MPFPFDKYPWLNFQELNLAYFIKHFREIFEQWNTLLNEMHEWKDSTDAELEEWKSTVETGISSWETGLQQSMEHWKNETEADISAWKAATLAALDAWKTATTAVFEQIRTEAAASAQAAAGSASQAESAKTAAQTAQAAAEAAAQSVSESSGMIQANRSSITAIENVCLNNEALTLPFTAETATSMRALPGNGVVITGTHNKGMLYPIHQGVFTIHGITFNVHNNQILIDGTADTTFNFSIMSGAKSTYPEIAAEDYTIPSGYTWYVTNSSVRPGDLPMSILARKKDNSGQAGIVTNTPVLFDSATWGGLFFNFPEGMEFHRSATIGFYPANVGTYASEESERVAVIASESDFEVGVNDYIIGSGTAAISRYSNKAIDYINSILKPAAIKDNAGVHLYIPTANGKHFLEYLFVKVLNTETHADGWRLAYLWICNPDKTHITYIAYTGEWETALETRPIDSPISYIGLGNHGYEEQIYTRLYIDGENIDLNTNFAERFFSEAQLITKLSMLSPYDDNPVIAYHTRIDTIDGIHKTVTIANRIEFVAEMRLGAGYLFMAPIDRAHGSYQITDTFIDSQDFVLTDCSTSTFDPDNAHDGVGKTKDAYQYLFWGSSFDLHGHAHILEREIPSRFTPFTRVSSNESYNKIYMSACSMGESVQAGDVWKMTTEFFCDSGY